ncbi:MAG: flagellin [Pseudomonadota bacterium]|nr:flagellin [Pseudomonadota bacterium]MED5300952.1 flagellin [Pseudomonadota bacterium]|tara:strand:- start:565 stop:1419 length:855 start_codon:yes stop_codon:yes gene_type:complete
MSNSIITNPEAFVALRNLERTNEKLSRTQERLSTGLKVTSATDDASNFAIAQGVRGDVRALSAITQGLNNSKGIGEIALAGVTAISDLLQDIRQKLTELANGGLTTAQRVIVKADFDKLMSQAYGFVSNSNFNGRNLLISDATNVNTISNLNGTNLTLTARSGSNSGVTHLIRSLAGATLGTTGAATDAVNAQSVIALQYSALETEINTSLGALGAEIRALKFQTDFLTTVNDSTEIGLGNIVDADLARESAELTALQVRQQLGVQVLGIANQQPQILLNLLGN